MTPLMWLGILALGTFVAWASGRKATKNKKVSRWDRDGGYHY